MAQLSPTMLAVATDRGSMVSLLERRSNKVTRGAFPAVLPEWKYINQDSDIWAIRHYRKHTLLDPVVQIMDRNAVGWVFDGTTPHTVLYLSTGGRAENIARRFFESKEDGLVPTVNRISQSAVRVSAGSGSDDEASLFLLQVLYALGFAIAL